MKKLVILVLLVSLGATITAKPPKPPKGYRWVLNTQFSDEFNGNELDKNKWMNQFNGGWLGRPPAWFNPDAVWVEDGLLKIRSGALTSPRGRNNEYTMYGGAVSSVSKEAHFGYYECKAKASKIAMSTTFWMSNDKVPFTENDDCKTDSYSQELDIQEGIGGCTVNQKFINGMNCNTHFRYVKCGERKETFISKGSGTTLKSEVSDEYHIYAAWWKNPNEVLFYANNELFDTVHVRTDVSEKPFDRPMQINMVTETYDWQPAPSVDDLENDAINTASYDWVRSYELVPINKKVKSKHSTVLYDNVCTSQLKRNSSKVELNYTYQLNEDCLMVISLKNAAGEVIKKTDLNLLKGYGNNSLTIKLSEKEIGAVVAYDSEVVSSKSKTHVVKSKGQLL